MHQPFDYAQGPTHLESTALRSQMTFLTSLLDITARNRN